MHRCAVFLFLIGHASAASATTLQAWTDDGSNYVRQIGDQLFVGGGDGSIIADGKILAIGNVDGSGLVHLESGYLKVSSASGPSFDTGGGGAILSFERDGPLLINVGGTLEPIQLSMSYDGFYDVPMLEDTSATSTALVSVLTSLGSSSASLTHIVGYSNGGYQDGFTENSANGGSTSSLYDDPFLNGNSRLRASVATGLVNIPAGQSADISFMLNTDSINGASTDFSRTAYLSIFVQDKSAFYIDPRIASWVYEFGEAGNGPSAGPDPEPDINPVPLPAGFPMLLMAFTGLLGLRYRASRRVVTG